MFTDTLLTWYENNGRDLPWRNTKNPYLIWISEIILQQTRVNQGYDYYLRFIKRFPTVEALAQADEDEVLKYWQGLGYYSRARYLHAAAKSIHGSFPNTYEEVRALKGVGDYTAAAICSIAFGLPYAVVDGNVYRVLSRFFGIDTPIDTSAGKKEFANLAQKLLEEASPAKYNQAIMDFGAIQCKPQSPNCLECPLVDSCYAYDKDVVNSLPVKKGKVKVRNRYFNYFFIKQGEYTYLEKRTKKDIWHNLYQFPLVESSTKISFEELLRSNKVQEFLKQFTDPTFTLMVDDFKHVLSHQHIHTSFYRIDIHDSGYLTDDYTKIKLSDIDQYAIPRLIHLFVERFL